MRYKRLNLNSVSLTTHPLTCELTQHDRFELSVTNDLSFLSRQHAQCLLDVHPLPVVIFQEHYHSLTPPTQITHLRAHPDAHKLMVTLAVYDDHELEILLPSFLLLEPALSLRTHTAMTTNLHQRHKAHKAHRLHSPTKKQLAQLADCSPSAFR